MFKRILALASLLLFVASILAVNTGGATTKNLVSAPLVPRIVAQVSLTGQTGPIPQTTIFTPTKSGLFRISAVLASTTPGAGEPYTLKFEYTDDVTLYEYIYLLCPGSGYVANVCTGGPNSTFRAVAGTPVNFYVLGDGPGVTYNVFITIEQLM